MSNHNLIWIDLEMTGLNPNYDRILEIATVVTDKDLHIIADGPVFAIHQNDEMLNKMDSWNKDHHGKSGLVTRVQKTNVTESIAEAETLAFLKQYVGAKKSPMCGNSICQDRRFLYNYMPHLEEFFHYRNLDVSTVKLLAQYWNPNVAADLNKTSEHIALKDIYDSIEELRYYRKHIFIE